MCYMMKSFGMMALIPVTVLLVVSFFVMLTMRKLETGSLKTFGKVIVVLLFICAAMVIVSGIYSMSKGDCFKSKMTQGRMNRHPMIQDMPNNRMMAH